MLGGPQTFATPGLQARYLWFMLPGPFRILSLCEFQAWQKQPYVWRQLSGTYNAALNGVATQSSTLAGWGDGQASRAVDGLVTNRLDGAEPYTASSTNTGDNPGPWWQVDFGQVVDVQSVVIYGRNDCCGSYNGPPANTVGANWGWPATVPPGTVFNTGFSRNWMTTWAIGMSGDWTYDTICTAAPNDFTPVRAGPITSSNNWGTCVDLSLSDCAKEPNCYSGSDVVNQVGKPPTACFVKFPCATRGRYLTGYKTAFAGGYIWWDQNQIMLGEVQVVANKLLNMPAGRAGAAMALYAGCMVLFGGADSSGFRYNDVRFFDMLRNVWLPAASPLGTTPTARTAAAFVLIPSRTPGVPSNSFALIGGYSNTNQLNDVNTLAYPQCQPYSTVGVDTVNTKCLQGGTVCYVVCAAFATSTNGKNPLVCQTDGTWRGNSPPCVPTQLASAPQSVTASVNAQGVVTVSWAAPATSGYPFPGVTNQIQAYEVQVASGESIEYYNTMAFPAWQPSFAGPEAGCTGASPCARGGSAYVGGNWYRLLEKNGGGAWLNYVVTNNLWDFWQGWLRLNSDINRNNWVRVSYPAPPTQSILSPSLSRARPRAPSPRSRSSITTTTWCSTATCPPP